MGFIYKNRIMRSIVSLLLAGVILVTPSSGAANSEKADGSDNADEIINPGDGSNPVDWPIFKEKLESGGVENEGIMAGAIRTDLYQLYIAKFPNDTPKPKQEITIPLSKFDNTSNDAELTDEGPEYKVQTRDDKGDCLLWGNDLGRFEYTFNVPETGLYNMEFLYQTLSPEEARDVFEWPEDKSDSGKNNSIELGLLIQPPNGKLDYPFSAMRTLSLDKYWQNDGVITKLENGHEQMPLQVQNNVWINYKVKDKEGMFNDPYFFYLEAGENKLVIEGIKVNGVAFNEIKFKNYEPLPKYADIKPTDEEIKATPKLTGEKNLIGSQTIFMQGETPYWRSSLELGPTADRTTYQVSPSHHVHTRYNTVGGDGTWGQAGQSITWEFTVPEAGYYRIAAKVKQNQLRGFRANRRVLINGEVPCEEFNAQTFKYDTNWYRKNFTDGNGDDIYIHLDQGINYITLEAVPGEIGETMQRVSREVTNLNYYYRRILMVVGPNPDEFNDYRVDDQIPELITEFKRIRDSLRNEKKIVEKYSTGGSEASTLETMAVILDRCIKNPDRIPLRLTSLRDNIGALSAWVNSASRQPLEVDYIEVATSHEGFGSAKVGFFKQLYYLWRGFIASFFEDYTKLDGTESRGSLKVWVGLGRDQALVLKNLLGDYNRQNKDSRSVTLNLVQGGIMEASLAGKGPDVALFIGGDFPIQLAARKMIVDISQYDDYQQIVDERFVKSLPTFFTYLDGVYALPLTQAFPMMFYRSDILNDLGIDPPESWDDFIEAIAVLNRAYLRIGLLPPLNPAVLGSTIFEPGETFTLLQLQTGNGFYRQNDNGIYYETTFDDEASIQAFTTLTKFYTVYQFEQTYDPFTRFRTGEMPIVIQPFPFFNQLNAAAPEIKGLWDFQHVPGTWRTDEAGEQFLDISASSGASGGIIFSKLNEEDRLAAWQFLKWLTSENVQTLFGQNMEAMLGPLGRYETANIRAFSNLAWTERQLRKLEEQRNALTEIPMIPANYAATRHIKNAFRSVVNDNSYPRFALNSYNRDIKAEITRKNAELKRHDY